MKRKRRIMFLLAFLLAALITIAGAQAQPPDISKLSRVKPFVGRQECFQGISPIRRKILTVGEKGVFLALDEFTILTAEAVIFTLANLIHGFV